MPKRRARLRDFFAGRTGPAEGQAPLDVTPDAVADASSDGADVEGALRECRHGHAEMWDRIENEAKRERRGE